MSGFIGPLEEWDWRCPVCGNDPYDQSCHHPDCPTVCERSAMSHRCPQTNEDLADRFARIYGAVDLPTPSIPDSWKVSERLNAYFARRKPPSWAARDAGTTATLDAAS